MEAVVNRCSRQVEPKWSISVLDYVLFDAFLCQRHGACVSQNDVEQTWGVTERRAVTERRGSSLHNVESSHRVIAPQNLDGKTSKFEGFEIYQKESTFRTKKNGSRERRSSGVVLARAT